MRDTRRGDSSRVFVSGEAMQYIFLDEVSYTGWSGQTLPSDSFAPEARAEGTSIANASQVFR